MKTKDQILNDIVAKQQQKEAIADSKAAARAEQAKEAAAEQARKAQAMTPLAADDTIEAGLGQALAAVRERLQVGRYLPTGELIHGGNPREIEETLFSHFVTEFIDRLRSGEV